jgi:hypothetical protein
MRGDACLCSHVPPSFLIPLIGIPGLSNARINNPQKMDIEIES